MEHIPARMTYESLAEMLRDLAHRIEIGDSYEGFIEYLIPYGDSDDEDYDSHAVDVRARFRIGNLEGQGGMAIVGEFRSIPKEAATS